MEFGDPDFTPVFQGRLMGADAGAGPVGAQNIIGDRAAVLQNGADELVDHMGVGTAVTASLGEG